MRNLRNTVFFNTRHLRSLSRAVCECFLWLLNMWFACTKHLLPIAERALDLDGNSIWAFLKSCQCYGVLFDEFVWLLSLSPSSGEDISRTAPQGQAQSIVAVRSMMLRNLTQTSLEESSPYRPPQYLIQCAAWQVAKPSRCTRDPPWVHMFADFNVEVERINKISE